MNCFLFWQISSPFVRSMFFPLLTFTNQNRFVTRSKKVPVLPIFIRVAEPLLFPFNFFFNSLRIGFKNGIYLFIVGKSYILSAISYKSLTWIKGPFWVGFPTKLPFGVTNRRLGRYKLPRYIGRFFVEGGRFWGGQKKSVSKWRALW